MRHLSLFLTALLATASACMLGPVDGKVVQSKESVIAFNGFHLYAGNPAHIQAKNFRTGLFETVRSPNAATTSAFNIGGTNLYQWHASLALPNQYWQAGARGARAEVRTLWSLTNDNGGPVTPDRGAMISVEASWHNCYQSNPTAAGFRDNCAGRNSPIAEIKTQDYCPLQSTLRLSSPTVEHQGIYGDYEFRFRTINGARVRMVVVNGVEIDCELHTASPAVYRCRSNTRDGTGPFDACEINRWLENDGMVHVYGSAGANECFQAQNAHVRVARPRRELSGCQTSSSGGTGGDGDNTTVPPDPGAQRLCKSAPTPAGWIMVDDFWSNDLCSSQSSTDVMNSKLIRRFDPALSGTILDVCVSEGIPAGWTAQGDPWLDRTRCGHPALGFTPNVRRIRKP